jgi:membrane fusion protein (multidrug efflux system)
MTGRPLLLLGVFALSTLSASCRGSSPGAGQTPGAAPGLPTVEVAVVVSSRLHITIPLPGELQPYQVVPIYPKVTGFVRSISVDRGTHVREGQSIARLDAPELGAQQAEAQARLQGAEAQLAAARARLASDEGTYQRLKAASATPGVVAGNDLEVLQRTTEADRALVKAQRDNVDAARQALQSAAEIGAYLDVRAPFDGVVTERNAHAGALVGPAGTAGVADAMVRIETLSRLRLVVPVPETYAAGIREGTRVDFAVPAYPGRTFSGTIARISHAVNVRTRTMPVELEVANPSGELDPGTYTEVLWPVERPYPTLFVPSSAVTTTLERTFVVRVRAGKAEWVDVKTGASSGRLIEVFGDLREMDEVALRGTDELRPGASVTPHVVPVR